MADAAADSEAPPDTLRDLLTELQTLHAEETASRLASLSARERDAEVRAAASAGIPIDQLGLLFSSRGALRALWGWNARLPVTAADGSSPDTPETAARAFLARYGRAFGLVDERSELVVSLVRPGAAGWKTHFQRRTSTSLPVFGNGVSAHLTADLQVRGVSGLVRPGLPVSTVPRITADEARDTARIAARTGSARDIELRTSTEPELGIFDPAGYEVGGLPVLAWRVVVSTNEPADWETFIDAETGFVVHRRDRVQRHTRREIWQAGTPETLIFRDDPYYLAGSWPGTTEQVYDGVAWTEQFYRLVLSRDSWDDGLMAADLHRMKAVADAGGSESAWYPETATVRIGTSWACTDVVAHEFGHAVTYAEGGSPGVLVESLADIFGELTESYRYGSADWVFPASSCGPIRSLSDPENPADPDYRSAAHWDNHQRWGRDSYDSAGVTNKSAWLLGRPSTDGSTTFAGIGVQGIGHADAGRVWHRVVQYDVTPSISYTELRAWMAWRAYELFFTDSRYQSTVNAMDAVGLWTGDIGVSTIDTDSPVAYQPFVVSSQQRWHLLYREPVAINPHLLYRYRTCPLNGQCSWSAATALSFTGKGPTGAVFPLTSGGGDRLWVFYKYDLSNTIYFKHMSSSGSWSTSAPLGTATTDGNPSAVVFGGFLYVFYKAPGSGAQPIHYMRYSPATGWQGPVVTPATSEVGPAAAGPLHGRLYLVYRRGPAPSPPFAEHNVRYRSMWSSGSWTSEQTIPCYDTFYPFTCPQTGETPAAAIHRGRIHVATRSFNQFGTEPDYVYHTSMCLTSGDGCSYRVGEWTHNVVQEGTGESFVSLVQHDNRLYRASRGGGMLLWRNKLSE